MSIYLYIFNVLHQTEDLHHACVFLFLQSGTGLSASGLVDGNLAELLHTDVLFYSHSPRTDFCKDKPGLEIGCVKKKKRKKKDWAS